MRRRAGYEDYTRFASQYDNRCSLCGTWLARGVFVLGRSQDNRWDIVCEPCGTGASDPGADRPPRHAPVESDASDRRPPPARADTQWSRFVRYLRQCVERESALDPIPLDDRDRWKILPLRQESVLCGADLTVPLLPQVQELIRGLGDMEAVFYGWPVVVVTDDRDHPFVAPLFYRRLQQGVPVDGVNGVVPLSELLPQVNMGLIGSRWFSPDLVSGALDLLAAGAIGFGQPAALATTALGLLSALGLPLPPLDPGALLEDASPPQEVGVFNLVMAGRAEFDDDATRALRDDLKWMERATDWRAGAGRLLFEAVDAGASALAQSCAIDLNDSQERALASASRAPLTVITGPPGTGKSQTVVGIVADAWLRGETVLLASTNNAPIDSVVRDKMAAVDDGLVLRTGNSEVRGQLATRLRALVEEIGRRPDPGASPPHGPAALVYHQAGHELGERARVEGAVLAAAERRDLERTLLWGGPQVPPEVAPIRDRIGARARRAMRTRWRWLRRRRARACLALAGITAPEVEVAHVVTWTAAEDAFDDVWRDLQALRSDHPGEPLDRFQAASEAWRAASAAEVRARVRRAYVDGAATLIELAGSMADTGLRRELVREAGRHVRGWATSALSTRPSFDCRAGSIDLVVIDEASQCNLAQVLPLVYRAKRLVIVGDPAQLTPVVTVPAEELSNLAAEAGLDHETLVTGHLTYGRDSAYSAFAARSTPHLLNEHYRCHPEIIRFCNEQFYGGRLVVLSRVDRDDDRQRGLAWCEVEGRTEPGPRGSPTNRAEAEAVARWVAESGLPVEDIGVVTPFRDQARLIHKLLAGGPYARVQIGTAHTFQGGERDTVLFSTVLSVGCRHGTATWVEGERNLINVAVSRARTHLLVFGNRAELKRVGSATLVALADVAAHHGRAAEAPLTLASRRLHEALLDRGLPARLGEADEGYPVTMALDDMHGGRIDVEVSEFPRGDPRGAGQRQHQVRDANLCRLGWRVVRVPGWRAYLEPDVVAAELLRVVKEPAARQSFARYRS